jgi:hypothetical protein
MSTFTSNKYTPGTRFYDIPIQGEYCIDMNDDQICDVTFVNGTMILDERPVQPTSQKELPPWCAGLTLSRCPSPPLPDTQPQNQTIADREFTNAEIKKSLEWLDESKVGTIEESAVETDEEPDSDSDNGDDKPNPYCDKLDDLSVACHDRRDYYQGGQKDGLYPCNDGTDKKDWRDCKDASGYDYDNDDDNDNPRDDPDCWYGNLYVCDESGECDNDKFDCVTDCEDGSNVTTGEECPGEDDSDEPADDETDEEDTGGSDPEGEEEDQSCGGESCTDDEKEDSTTDLEEEEGFELN